MADKSEFRESVKQKPSKSSKLFVVAIDFGTAFSGYAYSSKAEWTKVYANKWSGGEQISYKAPSALLLNPDESFNSFGFDAVNNYASLVADEDCQDYFFFHRFKMILKTSLEERVHRKTQCVAENGKSVDAMKVFTLSINYMKDHLFTFLQDKVINLSMEDIDFVITVPAIWDDTAKMFMREAAESVGIKRDRLKIALEPEAASIYCQLMHLESSDNSRFFLAGKEVDAKYMVLDLGGGTADITVHQLKKDGTLAELVPASGGAWGGTCVDQAFQDFLVELLGEDVMRIFKMDPEYVEDYFDFWQTFEIKKRSFETSKKETFLLRLPVGLADIVADKMNKKGNITNKSKQEMTSDIIMQEVIRNSRFKDELNFEHGKLQMKYAFFKQMFDPTVKLLTDHLSKLNKDIGEDLKVILMVGGFSECSIVQEAVREVFRDKCRVVIPNQAGLAVLKGAVYFGHQPYLISERVARYTYGIQTWPKFDKAVHKTSKFVMMEEEERCRDVFFRFIAKGERIKPGDKKSYIFNALKPGERALECGVFISTEEDPQYVDEKGCVKLGVLEVPLQSVRLDGKLEIEESLIFGHTELQVTACNCHNKKEYKVTFDLLSPEINFPDK
ncbi:heat shock 70 kDa protein 12B-like isoform X1 [Saccostrea echinata]|uniref:heat shock 70 kDa protein 12B-like isoform X1 n=1 Tax=Saccostrea echinata TaxID=191078 RepID=UPI002A838B87|nr:heat shock 70 kDa protein 12B-like isoform X1 [Saccostrea echinata]